MKDVLILGGPNGAGKTTWAYRRLAPTLEIREFVNADEIARGISPLDPKASALAASRLMIDRLNELVSAGDSFAFETTCMRHLYLPLADLAFVYDNSDESGILIAERRENTTLLIHDNDRWSRIEEATR